MENNILTYKPKLYNAPKEVIENDIAEFITSTTKSGILIPQSNSLSTEKVTIASVFLHLTDKCNLRCKHCYAVNMSEGCQELTTQEFITFLEQFYAEGGNTVVVPGASRLSQNRYVFEYAMLTRLRRSHRQFFVDVIKQQHLLC